jgi:hypothetical protein
MHMHEYLSVCIYIYIYIYICTCRLKCKRMQTRTNKSRRICTNTRGMYTAMYMHVAHRTDTNTIAHRGHGHRMPSVARMSVNYISCSVTLVIRHGLYAELPPVQRESCVCVVCVRVCMPCYMHTYIYTYTYLHTYIHTARTLTLLV